jgi:hypothetical protein
MATLWLGLIWVAILFAAVLIVTGGSDPQPPYHEARL